MGFKNFLIKCLKKISPSAFFVAIGSSILNIMLEPVKNIYKNTAGKVVNLIKALWKAIKIILKILLFLFRPPQVFVTLAIAVAILLAIFAMMFMNTILEAFGGFRGTVDVDIGKMQEMNQDTSAYNDMLNTDGLIEAFYDDVSATSFYQAFNLRDMDTSTIGPFERLGLKVRNSLSKAISGNNSNKFTYEDIMAQKKSVNGVNIYRGNTGYGYISILFGNQYDPRYILTDANKNPVRYITQAQVIGTDETSGNLKTYFRDYYNKEKSFQLSPALLYDLNQWAYGIPSSGENIVYPEAFTKPIHFVNDFRRIQTDKDDENYGKPYVYITQRVTLDNIRDIENEFYGRSELEGLIYTTPSNIVWDYAIVDSNEHQVKISSESQTQVNVGNVSEYASEDIEIKYGGIDEDATITGTGTGGSSVVGGETRVLGLGDTIMSGTIKATGNKMVNGAVNGETITSIKNRVSKFVDFEYVVLSAGINDWDKSDITSSYVEMLNELKTANPHIKKLLVINLPYIPDSVESRITNETVESFNSQIQSAVSQVFGGVGQIIDLYTLVKNNPTYIASGGMSLTDGGYTALANKITGSGITLTSASGNISSGNSKNEDKTVDSDNTTQLVKLYWKVKDECMDTHMGGVIDEAKMCSTDASTEGSCFIGPYLTMTANENGTVELSDLITESATYASNKIEYKKNKCPARHVQLAPIFDNDGNMLANSRNLFNKTYVRQKVVKSSYRNSDAYWADFEEFIQEDISRGASLTCNSEQIAEERYLPWNERRCSVIRWSMSNTSSEWLMGKIKEIAAYITSGSVEDATMNITAEGVYRILIEYEDYLIANGTYNEQWEYRYFAVSETDKFNALKAFTFSLSGSGGAWGGWYSGIAEMLASNSDTFVYKDTFEVYVESNDDRDDRSISSEYVPVAVVSGGSGVDSEGNYKDVNNYGYGYKYDTKTGEIRRVEGEASLQMPTYFNGSLSEMFKSTIYGQPTYGKSNFIRYWNGDEIAYNDSWTGVEDDLIDDGIISLSRDGFTKEEIRNLDIEDFRNDEYVWNNEATVWRPTESADGTVTMQQCSDSSCGRITTQNYSDDYLPMEVKSVRDYGLGSVLSYIEDRKVVFKTGLAVSELYDGEAVNNYFVALFGGETANGDKNASKYLPNAKDGYYPIQLFDNASDYRIDVNVRGEAKNASIVELYRRYPEIVKNINVLDEIAHMFLNGQGTGNKSVTLTDGKICSLKLTHLASAGENDDYRTNRDPLVSNMYAVYCKDSSDGAEYATGMYAFIPHIIEGGAEKMKDMFNAISGGKYGKSGVDQFWNPVDYYLAWFDYSEDELEDEEDEDIFSKLAKIIKNDEFYSQIDTEVAKELRRIKDTGSNNFGKVSEISDARYKAMLGSLKYFVGNVTGNKTIPVWGTAGTDMNAKNVEKFFANYSNDIKPIDLIDYSQTQKIYLIEEAATFLGEFMYSYESTMDTIGPMKQENAIISETAWTDRYYYLSNYVFAVPVYKYEIEPNAGHRTCWTGRSGGGCESDSVSLNMDIDKRNIFFNLFDAVLSFFENGGVYKEDSQTTELYSGWIYQATGNSKEVPYTCCSKDKDGNRSCDTCYYTSYEYRGQKFERRVVNNHQHLRLDTPYEITKLANQLKANGHTDTANKLWINMKVYEDLSNKALFRKSNTAYFNESLVFDYSENNVVGNDGQNLPTSSGWLSTNYAAIGYANKEIKNRSGLKVTDAVNTFYDPTKLVQDSEYQVNFSVPGSGCQDGKLDKCDFIGVTKKVSGIHYGELTNKDIEYIHEAIIDMYGDDYRLQTEEDSVQIYDVSVPYRKGRGIGRSTNDKKNVLVGISMADRTDEGYPIPLYMHLAGDIKQIMPVETGSFFNGENLAKYRSRLASNEDETLARYRYIVKEKDARMSYLYDYLMNFEAYVPLDVKSDGDLQVRGYGSLLAVRVNYNTATEETTSYSSQISSAVKNSEFSKMSDAYKNSGITERGVSQVVAGLIEVSIKNAPIRMITTYNKMLDAGGSSIRIENSDDNIDRIIDVIRDGKNQNTQISDLGKYRKVSLKVSGYSDGEKEFIVPTLGPGGITAIGSYSGDDIGLGTLEGLTITSNQDDRFDVEKSTQYVTDKFVKLLSKYGNVGYAVNAYLYGEDYWNALSTVLGRKGTTVMNWSSATTSDILEALSEIAGDTVTESDVDVSMYDPSVAKDVLSYISDASERTNAIQKSMGNSSITSASMGKYASQSEAVYKKWQFLIDQYSAKYGIDPAVISAIWSVESSGSAFAGVCSRDNVDEVCGGAYNSACKAQLKCKSGSNYLGSYNGGGGLGQVHDTSGGKGNGYTRTVSSQVASGNTVSAIIYNPRTQASEFNIVPGGDSGSFNMQGYMKKDTRFDPEIGGEWSAIYISNLLDNYDGDVYKMLVGYNAGPGNLSKYVKHAKERGYGDDWVSYYRDVVKGKYIDSVLSRYSTNISNGSLSVSNGVSFSGTMDVYANTSAYNAYRQDLIGVQNTGVELYGRPKTLLRSDIDMILVSATRNEDDNAKTYEYDIFNFFNVDAQSSAGATGSNGDWELSSDIVQLGSSRPTNEVKQNDLTGFPPLFWINAPLGQTREYKITSRFGLRRSPGGVGSTEHQGIDIGAPLGTEIYPIAPGVVSSVKQQASGSTGVAVFVEHPDAAKNLPNDGIVKTSTGRMFKVLNVRSAYYHMKHGSNTHLSVGQAVGINDCIGQVNSTGASTGNHLHLDIHILADEIDAEGNVIKHINWTKVDPEPWLTTVWKDANGNQLPSYSVRF